MFFRELIDVVPFWWLITLCIIFFMAITYSSARISVRLFSRHHHRVDKEHRQLANAVIGILSGGFSILLAFVIINTWNYLLQARSASSKEADYLAVLIRNMAVFPPEAVAKISEATRNYTVAVRVDEWQTMKKGKESQQAWEALEALYANIQAFQPTSKKEDIFYRQMISNVNYLLQARRERLNELESVIPAQLRESLIIGSILLAIIIGVIRGEQNFLQVTPILLYSAILGFNLAIALSFDYPFSGDIAISNKQFYSGALGKFPD